MDSFSGEPRFKYIGKGMIEMLEDFTYFPPKKYGYEPVTTPKGFQSDLISVPPWLRWIIHKYGDTLIAALPHDRLYHTQERPRKEADHIILLALIDANRLKKYKIGRWKRFLIYRSVRAFGFISWNKRAKELISPR